MSLKEEFEDKKRKNEAEFYVVSAILSYNYSRSFIFYAKTSETIDTYLYSVNKSLIQFVT